MDSGGTMMAHGGTYEAYSPEKIAWAGSGKVVLFFRASWCPTCKTVDTDIRSKLSSIPKDVTILDVNYDTETALRQKYGVTYQHTFVQVDAEGNQLAKWSGSPTLAALLGNVK
jgi:thiol-disulfide isomerase/thioredoxin